MQTVVCTSGLELDFAARAPRLTVDPGERFVVETQDALGGRLTSEDQPPTREHLGDTLVEDRFNPVTGPIAVRGARPGDVLAITIHAIDLAPTGVTCVFEGLGPLADSATHPDCHGPFTKVVEQSSDGTAGYGVLRWPLAPHVGTIALAVPRPLSAGADSNYGQGPFGGNLDCRDIAPGNTLLLPVTVEGGLLYLGDVHGCMADGELFGAGVESRARVTLSCEPRRGGGPLAFARVETPSHVVQLNSAWPIEAALDQAFLWTLQWLVDEHGLSSRDAYVLLGIHPDVRISVFQAVRLGRLRATVGVCVPRSLLDQLRA